MARSGADVLISSDNPDLNDETPHATMNNQGIIVVAYEKEINTSIQRIPVIYSKDNGATWIEQFELNSTGFYGSDYLQSPDIKYCPVADEFFVHMIDPYADPYNEILWWIDGDIANDTEAFGYGIGVQGGLHYTEGACAYVGQWFLGLFMLDSYILGCPFLGYWYWDGIHTPMNPVDFDHSWAQGFYSDGQSVLKTAAASQPEMATGNNLYMVMQSFNGVYSNISFKATVTNLDPDSPSFLFTSGGGPNDMDKYADIEVWPIKQFYVAVNATDPDISTKGDVVAVVYKHAGNVMCRTSLDAGGNWTDATTVAAGGYPAVFVTEGKIYVAYVYDGNLFYKMSTDNGTTWGAAYQINDVSGTVAAITGTVDIGAAGFVWTDNRNGKNDIYHEYLLIDVPEPPVHYPKLEITAITGGIGVSTTISNTGAALATNITWTIEVTGGIFGLISVTETGTVATLVVDGEISGRTKMILGFGLISVKVTATCDEGSTVDVMITGKQLLIFTSIRAE
jgi:hypothetical protein